MWAFKKQIIKHVLSVGTGGQLRLGQLNISAHYSWLRWHHDLYTYITVGESYVEREISIRLNWIYSPT
ncbi:MAG: hypothetical protein K9M49_05040 [Candidatus Marinimicrobia bacterium]|nr:hypothetical protein [Candidatus Neomarinimicrobiota bacterium]MCF7904501.1 hypothetical protein [Candidatus Neomarinimicrobiota bacterium]